MQLRQKYQEFNSLRAVILAVAPDNVNITAELARVLKLPYYLLADPLQEAFKKYSLVSGENLFSGDFVIDAGGIVRYAHRGKAPEDRPPLAKLLEAVKSVTGQEGE